jgi:hypothetical protein
VSARSAAMAKQFRTLAERIRAGDDGAMLRAADVFSEVAAQVAPAEKDNDEEKFARGWLTRCGLEPTLTVGGADGSPPPVDDEVVHELAETTSEAEVEEWKRRLWGHWV